MRTVLCSECINELKPQIIYDPYIKYNKYYPTYITENIKPIPALPYYDKTTDGDDIGVECNIFNAVITMFSSLKEIPVFYLKYFNNSDIIDKYLLFVMVYRYSTKVFNRSTYTALIKNVVTSYKTYTTNQQLIPFVNFLIEHICAIIDKNNNYFTCRDYRAISGCDKDYYGMCIVDINTKYLIITNFSSPIWRTNMINSYTCVCTVSRVATLKELDKNENDEYLMQHDDKNYLIRYTRETISYKTNANDTFIDISTSDSDDFYIDDIRIVYGNDHLYEVVFKNDDDYVCIFNQHGYIIINSEVHSDGNLTEFLSEDTWNWSDYKYGSNIKYYCPCVGLFIRCTDNIMSEFDAQVGNRVKIYKSYECPKISTALSDIHVSKYNELIRSVISDDVSIRGSIAKLRSEYINDVIIPCNLYSLKPILNSHLDDKLGLLAPVFMLISSVPAVKDNPPPYIKWLVKNEPYDENIIIELSKKIFGDECKIKDVVNYNQPIMLEKILKHMMKGNLSKLFELNGPEDVLAHEKYNILVNDEPPLGFDYSRDGMYLHIFTKGEKLKCDSDGELIFNGKIDGKNIILKLDHKHKTLYNNITKETIHINITSNNDNKIVTFKDSWCKIMLKEDTYDVYYYPKIVDGWACYYPSQGLLYMPESSYEKYSHHYNLNGKEEKKNNNLYSIDSMSTNIDNNSYLHTYLTLAVPTVDANGLIIDEEESNDEIYDLHDVLADDLLMEINRRNTLSAPEVPPPPTPSSVDLYNIDHIRNFNKIRSNDHSQLITSIITMIDGLPNELRIPISQPQLCKRFADPKLRVRTNDDVNTFINEYYNDIILYLHMYDYNAYEKINKVDDFTYIILRQNGVNYMNYEEIELKNYECECCIYRISNADKIKYRFTKPDDELTNNHYIGNITRIYCKNGQWEYISDGGYIYRPDKVIEENIYESERYSDSNNKYFCYFPKNKAVITSKNIFDTYRYHFNTSTNTYEYKISINNIIPYGSDSVKSSICIPYMMLYTKKNSTPKPVYGTTKFVDTLFNKRIQYIDEKLMFTDIEQTDDIITGGGEKEFTIFYHKPDWESVKIRYEEDKGKWNNSIGEDMVNCNIGGYNWVRTIMSSSDIVQFYFINDSSTESNKYEVTKPGIYGVSDAMGCQSVKLPQRFDKKYEIYYIQDSINKWEKVHIRYKVGDKGWVMCVMNGPEKNYAELIYSHIIEINDNENIQICFTGNDNGNITKIDNHDGENYKLSQPGIYKIKSGIVTSVSTPYRGRLTYNIYCDVDWNDVYIYSIGEGNSIPTYKMNHFITIDRTYVKAKHVCSFDTGFTKNIKIYFKNYDVKNGNIKQHDAEDKIDDNHGEYYLIDYPGTYLICSGKRPLILNEIKDSRLYKTISKIQTSIKDKNYNELENYKYAIQMMFAYVPNYVNIEDQIYRTLNKIKNLKEINLANSFNQVERYYKIINSLSYSDVLPNSYSSNYIILEHGNYPRLFIDDIISKDFKLNSQIYTLYKIVDSSENSHVMIKAGDYDIEMSLGLSCKIIDDGNLELSIKDVGIIINIKPNTDPMIASTDEYISYVNDGITYICCKGNHIISIIYDASKKSFQINYYPVNIHTYYYRNCKDNIVHYAHSNITDHNWFGYKDKINDYSFYSDGMYKPIQNGTDIICIPYATILEKVKTKMSIYDNPYNTSKLKILQSSKITQSKNMDELIRDNIEMITGFTKTTSMDRYARIYEYITKITEPKLVSSLLTTIILLASNVKILNWCKYIENNQNSTDVYMSKSGYNTLINTLELNINNNIAQYDTFIDITNVLKDKCYSIKHTPYFTSKESKIRTRELNSGSLILVNNPYTYVDIKTNYIDDDKFIPIGQIFQIRTKSKSILEYYYDKTGIRDVEKDVVYKISEKLYGEYSTKRCKMNNIPLSRVAYKLFEYDGRKIISVVGGIIFELLENNTSLECYRYVVYKAEEAKFIYQTKYDNMVYTINDDKTYKLVINHFIPEDTNNINYIYKSKEFRMFTNDSLCIPIASMYITSDETQPEPQIPNSNSNPIGNQNHKKDNNSQTKVGRLKIPTNTMVFQPINEINNNIKINDSSDQIIVIETGIGYIRKSITGNIPKKYEIGWKKWII